jgi:pyruvate formate lyase activating enzyme
MRVNKGGELFTEAYGELIAKNVDPVEKKPLYHYKPGTKSLSIATIGCNFRCSFCQNWSISQLSARDRHPDGIVLSPEEVVEQAVRNDCSSISYTYTEPTIFFEYALDTAKLAKKKGIGNIFVTNGYMTREAIDAISPYLDAANVDLKAFNDTFYEKICKAKLGPVLDSIEYMKKKGIWIEVTTLLVSGENDQEEEITRAARFLAGIDKNIPWHISRFHPDYKYTKGVPTPTVKIQTTMDIARSEGMKYIYPGNIAAPADTLCPECGATLIQRSGIYLNLGRDFEPAGRCKACGAEIKGKWE